MKRSGAVVFSSSRGGEFSYESDLLENGFFTEELINALTSDKADEDNDGTVSTSELRKYVGSVVSKRTNGMQNPTVDRDNIYQTLEFELTE
jgi:uncharacterized caspase-like protein